MPTGRAKKPKSKKPKPKPKPPERRYKVIYETKTGARRVDIVYATSEEGCLTHVSKRIGFAQIVSCHLKPIQASA